HNPGRKFPLLADGTIDLQPSIQVDRAAQVAGVNAAITHTTTRAEPRAETTSVGRMPIASPSSPLRAGSRAPEPYSTPSSLFLWRVPERTFHSTAQSTV